MGVQKFLTIFTFIKDPSTRMTISKSFLFRSRFVWDTLPKMRRDINWKTKRDDGTSYEVRVTWFSKSFKLQFKEKGEESWDYDRSPNREDLETLVDAIQRRYQRREATLKELETAQEMLKDFL